MSSSNVRRRRRSKKDTTSGVSREEFLRAVFHDIRDEEVLWLCEYHGDPDTVGDETPWLWGGHHAKVSDPDPNPEMNHYYSVASFKSNADGRKIEQASRLHALVFDDPVDLKLELPPSFINATSWDSSQVGYIFETPLDLTDDANIERAKALVSAATGAPVDKCGNNIVRYVRPPSGVNQKVKYLREGEAPRCRILEWHPERRYTVEQLEKMTAHLVVPAEKKKNKTTTASTGDKDALDWAEALKDIMTAEAYHEPTIRLAASAAAKGYDEDAIVSMIKAAFLAAGNKREEWEARLKDIERSVASGVRKYAGGTLKDLRDMEDVVGDDRIATSVPAMPEKLLNPPGRLKDLVDLILEQAIIPQPIFALGSAMCVVSSLTMNRITVGALQTRLNIYLGLVGPTSGGKERYRTIAGEVFDALGVDIPTSDGLASGPALLQTLNRNPVLVYTPDELGIVFSQAFREGGNSHDILMWKETLTLYGLAHGIHAGRRYADKKNNIPPIRRPFVNLIGATTPSTLVEGLSSRQVEDGTLNRFLFLETPTVPPKRRELPPKLFIPVKLKKALDRIGRTPAVPDNPENMVFSEEAEAAYWNAEAHFHTLARSSISGDLYGRAHEYTAKLAGIAALLMDENQDVLNERHQRAVAAALQEDVPAEPAGPIERLSVPLEAVEWAVGVVEHCLRCLDIRCRRDMADNPYAREERRVLGIIARAKEYTCSDTKTQAMLRDGVMPKSFLTRVSNKPARELDGILDSLLEQQAIEAAEEERKGNGRRMMYYKLTRVGREILFGE